MGAEMYELEFEIAKLPKLPNSLLGARWQARAAHANVWSRLVWKHCWHLKPPTPLKRASVTYTRCSSVRPDFDGLVGSFKHVQDGLVKCGILDDDTPGVIRTCEYLHEKAAPNAGKIRVRVVSEC